MRRFERVLRVCFGARRNNGMLRQMMIDDKGVVAILCFGAGGVTHENDALRALCAAAHVGHELNQPTANRVAR